MAMYTIERSSVIANDRDLMECIAIKITNIAKRIEFESERATERERFLGDMIQSHVGKRHKQNIVNFIVPTPSMTTHSC